MITSRRLFVRLSKEELAIRAKSLAQAVLEHTEIEEQKKAIAKEWKEKHEGASAVVRSLGDVVRLGQELQDVQCRTQRSGTMLQTVRCDTGEIIDERQLTEDERQGDLFDDATN